MPLWLLACGVDLHPPLDSQGRDVLCRRVERAYECVAFNGVLPTGEVRWATDWNGGDHVPDATWNSYLASVNAPQPYEPPWLGVLAATVHSVVAPDGYWIHPSPPVTQPSQLHAALRDYGGWIAPSFEVPLGRSTPAPRVPTVHAQRRQDHAPSAAPR